MNSTFIVTCTAEDEGLRVDQCIVRHAANLHRSTLKAHAAHITRDGLPVKLSAKVHAGDSLSVALRGPDVVSSAPEDIPLEIIAEESEYVVLHKPQGMVVHPGAGHSRGTLVHALSGRYRGDPYFHLDPHGTIEANRPGIVHRLDKETSGVMIVARTAENYSWLVDQFKSHAVYKEYLAVVKGVLTPPEARVSGALARDPRNRRRYSVAGELYLDAPKEPPLPSGARNAVTRYRVIAVYGDAYSLVRLVPITGRTHQLRVHLQALGHPILGDPLYARPDRRFPEERLMLHARRLTVVPRAGALPHTFTATVPRRFQRLLRQLVSRHEVTYLPGNTDSASARL
ncbi:MAG: RluA family pseudouridine synthase [Alkalispirochaeta sp.]